jgi:hypothetical protein
MVVLALPATTAAFDPAAEAQSYNDRPRPDDATTDFGSCPAEPKGKPHRRHQTRHAKRRQLSSGGGVTPAA